MLLGNMQYRSFFPVGRKVLKITIWTVPSAGGLILQLLTAQTGSHNL